LAEVIAKIQGLFSDAQKSISSTGDYLPILRGTVDTHGSKGWKRVIFSQTFKSPPQVMIQGSPGLSDYKPREVKFAAVNIPNIDVPTINVSLPNIQMPDFSEFLINQINATAWSNTGNVILDSLANVSKAPFIAMLLIFSHYIGQAFDKFNDDYIEPILNNIVQIIRNLRDTLNRDIIGLTDNPKVGTINKALDDTREQVENVINQIAGTMEFAINNTVDYVFEFLGVIDKIPLAPTATQNVSGTSFEFYSAGGKYDWFAIGVFV
jgi:hypothetical protein